MPRRNWAGFFDSLKSINQSINWSLSDLMKNSLWNNATHEIIWLFWVWKLQGMFSAVYSSSWVELSTRVSPDVFALSIVENIGEFSFGLQRILLELENVMCNVNCFYVARLQFFKKKMFLMNYDVVRWDGIRQKFRFNAVWILSR